MNRGRDHRQGFTLIELMIVITIMVILAAIAVGVGMYANTESMKKQTQTTEAILLNATQAYYEINGAYPSNVAALISVISGSSNMDRYAAIRAQIKNLPKDAFNGTSTFYDAWGRTLQYSSTGSISGGPLFWSYGQDGTNNTKDDIRSDNMPVRQ